MSASIRLHGHEFPVLFDDEGIEHVTIRALCKPFGLNVQAQTRRLEQAEWARIAKIATRRSDGKKADFFCIPLRRVPMFFATLSPGHVAEELRPALIAMQNEVADAVADYYLLGGAVRESALPSQLEALRDKLDEILRKEPLTDPIWPNRFVRRYAKWHGLMWKPGDRPPFSMKSANWFFYEMIFPRVVLDVIRARGLEAGVRYHQVLADAPRDYLARQLEIAAILADECTSETEWRRRMQRAYGKTPAALRGQESLDL